jgi:hypothetical protein
VAFPSAPFVLAKANLCFESNMPVVLGQIANRPVMLELDTGGGSNYLYQGFAKDFPEILRQPGAKNGKMSIGGVGGGVEGLQAVELPLVDVLVGGRVLSYKHTKVQLDDSSSTGSKFHGLLGLPLLSQAKSVTIDFGAMRVDFE